MVGLPPNVPHAGDTGLTLIEARSHFSLVSVFSLSLLALSADDLIMFVALVLPVVYHDKSNNSQS